MTGNNVLSQLLGSQQDVAPQHLSLFLVLVLVLIPSNYLCMAS